MIGIRTFRRYPLSVDWMGCKKSGIRGFGPPEVISETGVSQRRNRGGGGSSQRIVVTLFLISVHVVKSSDQNDGPKFDSFMDGNTAFAIHLYVFVQRYLCNMRLHYSDGMGILQYPITISQHSALTSTRKSRGGLILYTGTCIYAVNMFLCTF